MTNKATWIPFALFVALSTRLAAQEPQQPGLEALDQQKRTAEVLSKLAALTEQDPQPHSPEDVLKAKKRAEDLAKKIQAEAMYKIKAALAGSNRLVKDKPYSAEASTEIVQTLGDGNRIIRRNTTKYFRDRLGRTRREQTIESFGPSSPVSPAQLVFIHDPVAKLDLILDVGQGSARRSDSRDFELAKVESDAPKQDLGKRMIEGLECTGTRQTVVIPIGKIGNERPIQIVTETWYSPAIEAVVRSTTSDPRSGETIYTLHHVLLGEQPADLFVAPAEYKSK